MIIHSKFKDYEVHIEPDFGFLEPILKLENTEFVIDAKVYKLYEKYFDDIPKEHLILIDAKEENKVLDTALSVCEDMTKIPAKRNAVLVTIGGGILQDISGFAANVLYRGIKWILIPTTLLAACDSCIGGKSSLNYKGYKNLLGTFYPPDHVYICPTFFKTLSDEDFKSGMGEVIKFNLMNGMKGLATISTRIDELLDRQEKALGEFLINSLTFKKSFIEMDEFDQGERIKLNFAHTFGHAIEVISEYTIPHGTAVAIGMIIANHISVQRGLLNKQFALKSEELLLKVIDINVEKIKVPTKEIVGVIRKDKKQTSTSLTAVLMTNVAKELQIVRDLTQEEVEEGFLYFINLYDKSNR